MSKAVVESFLVTPDENGIVTLQFVQGSADQPTVSGIELLPTDSDERGASEHQHAMTSEVMAECLWTKPEQACEVEFIERTPRRRLRHAEFRRLLPRSGEK